MVNGSILANPPRPYKCWCSLRARIEAGRESVLQQVEYFRKILVSPKAVGKRMARVTDVDEAISQQIFPFFRLYWRWLLLGRIILIRRTSPLKEWFYGYLTLWMGPITMPWVFLNADLTWLAQAWVPVYGFIYDYGRDNLLQGGKATGSIEGSTPVHAATDLVNESLLLHALPHSHGWPDALREVLQEWRIRARIGQLAANVATGRLDGCLEFRSKPWDCAAGYAICGAGAEFCSFRITHFPWKHLAHRWEHVPSGGLLALSSGSL